MKLLRRVAGQERGFTLIELLTVAALLLVVMSATLLVLERTTQVAPRDQERAHSIREAQVGLYSMTRELRQAYAVNPPAFTASSDMDVKVVSGGVNKRVLYSCDEPLDAQGYRRCTRFEVSPPTDFAQPPPSTNGRVVVDRILNNPATDPVFTRSPSTSRQVGVRIRVPSRGERAQGFNYNVILDDGFFMRNVP